MSGQAALLVDLDPQGSATDHVLEEAPEHSVADVLLGTKSVQEACVSVPGLPRRRASLSLLASGGFHLNTAEVTLQARASKNRLRFVLDGFLGEAASPKLAIVDTGPGLDFLWYNALYASDLVLCPVELQMPALQGLRRFQQLLEFASEEDGLTPGILYLPTNNDGRLRESRDLLGVLVEQFGSFPKGKVLPSIRYSSALSKAYAQRQTIFDFDPSDQAAEDFAHTVNLVLQSLGYDGKEEHA
jgi:chromosome partitioning protein